MVKYLVEKGANIHGLSESSPSRITRNTPLHLASREGHIDMVKYLVEKGADVRALNLVSVFEFIVNVLYMCALIL